MDHVSILRKFKIKSCIPYILGPGRITNCLNSPNLILGELCFSSKKIQDKIIFSILEPGKIIFTFIGMRQFWNISNCGVTQEVPNIPDESCYNFKEIPYMIPDGSCFNSKEIQDKVMYSLHPWTRKDN